MTGRAVLGTALAVCAAAFAPAAQAATKTIGAGPSSADLKALKLKAIPANLEFDLFLRKTVTINAGDRVRWRINGSHTVTFLNRHKRPGRFSADARTPVSGVSDAAGSPFWFNGKPTLLYNSAVVSAKGGRAFDRRRVESSGLRLAPGKAKAYVLRFSKPGRFSYVCLLHPDMTGTVVVKRRRARIPRKADDRKAAKRELRKVVEAAIVREGAVVVTARAAQAGGTAFIQAGNDGPNFALMKFFPAEASVLAGVPIGLRVAPNSDANHTFTFGPSDLVKSLATNLLVRKSARRVELLPQAVWASDATLPPHSPTLHGNGFLNTGVLDTGALGDSPLPLTSNATVTFTTPGTYALSCLLHPEMVGKVEVVK